MRTIIRTYKELIRIPTFEERFEYLKIGGTVGADTFGFDRYINQVLYHSGEWKSLRNDIIVRDLGHELAMESDDYEIFGNIIIHHMNPITIEDIAFRTDYVMNPDFLVCCSLAVHNAIHYGSNIFTNFEPIVRKPFDTCPWRK